MLPLPFIKVTNIQIIGVPEEEEEKKGSEKIFEEIMLKTSLTWERKQPPKSRKRRVPYRINPRRNMPRHIVIKLTKNKGKEKLLKATREK